ncbi:putative bifunctional diguanylate cyclase/phosphodiesterase [Citreimonas sp.]|uniref:putative bifunctional diguanylate cyclase/phosphodiesterase n=1 Tax=Citreimonas sp. TaxID=3036715 RepID=UPI0035C85B0B
MTSAVADRRGRAARRSGGPARIAAARSRLADGKILGKRFTWVVLAGYIAAIIVVGFGVRFSAQPFLDQMQREAMTERAAARAREIDARIAEVVETILHLKSDESISRLVLGFDRVTYKAEDVLAELDGQKHVRHAILDYKGTPILRSPGFMLRESKAAFSAIEFYSAARLLSVERPLAEAVRLRMSDDDGMAHLLVVLPIASRGLVEGVLIVERVIELPTVASVGLTAPFSDSDWVVMSNFQLGMIGQWRDLSTSPIHARIGDTGYSLVRLANHEEIATLGWDLVQSVLFVVVWGMAVPFLGMVVFGRGVISKPYEALAASRQKLARSQKEVAELAQIATMSHEAILVTDRDQRIIWHNPAFSVLTGYAEEEALGRHPGRLLQGPDTDEETVARLRAAIASARPVREELVNYRRDGKPYWVSLSISPLSGEDGVVDRYVAISSDVTHKKLAERRLEDARRQTEHHALHDALTGLPNRRSVDGLLEAEIGSDDGARTLVRVDLDHFKAVNDTHGHAAGDHVLKHVSDALCAEIHETDFAGRIGGDEFVIALGPGRSAEDGVALAERLQSAIRRDVVFEGKTCRVGASFGVASSEDGLISNRQLLVAADAALYEAKEHGRSQTVLYTPEIHAGVQDKRRLSVEIERGIENEEFVPLFQPQVDAVTERVVGAEVLMRWQHPERGVLTPDQFLPMATRLALVPEIDRIIYRQGLRAAAEMERIGQGLPKISFNVGSAQIEDPVLISVADLYDIESTTVAFEILESVLVEEQSSNFRLQVDRLRDRGYRIEVDDFGSGHASVVGLMQLNPDAMKIDQRLIIPIISSAKTRDLVRHIVGIGRSFGISVTAEGVETAEHAVILRELGCNTLQGFHYARPLNVVELLDMVEERGTIRPGQTGDDPLPAGHSESTA